MNKANLEFGFGKFTIQLAIFTVVLFSIHNFIILPYLSAYYFYFETWKIYIFHFVSVTALIYFLKHRSTLKPDKVFNTFVILSILKMIAAVVFLLPLFFNKDIDSKASVFSFFIPYFIFLLLETRFALKILNSKE
jgi:uncharacterized membrane protein YadS